MKWKMKVKVDIMKNNMFLWVNESELMSGETLSARALKV